MGEICRIALLVDQDTGFFREVIRGIRSYAIDKPLWVFQNGPPEATTISAFRQWKPHGIIAQLLTPELATKALTLRRPMVDISYSVPGLTVPVVDVDHKAVGELAAEHFLERGYRHFGFFGSEWAIYSKLREESYQARLAEKGYTASTCYVECMLRLPALMEWKQATRRVHRWLQKLPKPAAIFCANDRPARDLADACMQLGLRVPGEVALLGVDNDDLDCVLASLPLSSISTPARQIGYQATKLLEGLMSGEAAPTVPILLPPSDVVVRQSTDTLAIDDPAVVSALFYIREHLADTLRVNDVAHHVAICRRMLEYKFRELVGHSVLEEIRRRRIQRVKVLLSDTDLAMPPIARRAGFSTPQRMAVVFRSETGMTPSEYRQQTQRAN